MPRILPGPSAMSPDRFRACLEVLGWGQREIGERLGINRSAIRSWAQGTRPIPAHVATWLDRLARVLEAHPLPDGWEAGRPAPPGQCHASKGLNDVR